MIFKRAVPTNSTLVATASHYLKTRLSLAFISTLLAQGKYQSMHMYRIIYMKQGFVGAAGF